MNDVDLRLREIVEANIIATHAYQVNLARASGRGDGTGWDLHGLDAAALQALVSHQETLVADVTELTAWVAGHPSAFDPARDLQPILASSLRAAAASLPVNVYTACFRQRSPAPETHLRAVASLLQMMMDLDRDATTLQRLYALYVALGLPVHTARLGLPETSDADFLALGRDLAPQISAAPFATDPATLQMMFRKMWNWGHRHTGERDRVVLANELLHEPAVQALLPCLRALPARKLAVIGHSFTMNVHWSSPTAFVPLVGEVLRQTNPGVQLRQWEAGGLTLSRPVARTFCQEALAWRPDQVLFVVSFASNADYAALEQMAGAFAQAGAQTTIFDSLGNPQSSESPAELARIAAATRLQVIAVGRVLAMAPDRDQFLCLDGVHKTEPYHRLMAKEWLRFLLTAR